MTEKLIEILENTKAIKPMVHSITNPITVNDCANIIHAAYGAPTMAQDAREVKEITSLCSSLVLNLGAIRAQEAMLIASKAASELSHPIVLDPVAVGASKLRSDNAKEIMQNAKITVLRGNASEIRAVCMGSHTTLGVEANSLDKVTEENLLDAIKLVRSFSKKTGCIIFMSGQIDLVSDDTKTAVLRGGSEFMSRITGAGCMLTALTATYCGANPNNCFEAAVCAAGVMNCCSEISEKRVRELMEGTASFRTRLIDAVSMLTKEQFLQHLNLQIFSE